MQTNEQTLQPTIAEMSEAVARYMGYKYNAIVDIDTSECGGIYERCKVFAKIPIDVDAYPEGDQYYLKDGWRSKADFDYLIDPDYLDWNNIHKVWEKVVSEEVDCMNEYWYQIELSICGNDKLESFWALYRAIIFINQLKQENNGTSSI